MVTVMFVTLLGALSEHFSPCLGVSTPLPSVLLPVTHKDSVLCDSYLTTAEYFVLCDVVMKETRAFFLENTCWDTVYLTERCPPQTPTHVPDKGYL